MVPQIDPSHPKVSCRYAYARNAIGYLLHFNCPASIQLPTMNWNPLDHLKSELKSSLWIIPFIAIPLELVATRIAHQLDSAIGLEFLGSAMPGAQALYQAIISATLAFLVFTFGSLLVAIQVASSQLTRASLQQRC